MICLIPRTFGFSASLERMLPISGSSSGAEETSTYCFSDYSNCPNAQLVSAIQASVNLKHESPIWQALKASTNTPPLWTQPVPIKFKFQTYSLHEYTSLSLGAKAGWNHARLSCSWKHPKCGNGDPRFQSSFQHHLIKQSVTSFC